MAPLFSQLALGALALATSVVNGEVYFQEQFDDAWTDRWTVSSWKDAAEVGEWKHTTGEWYGDEGDKGIQTGEDSRFYAISAPLAKEFTNEGGDLVIQYTVKHEQKLDCGGAYIKLMPEMDQSTFGGDTKYDIMFGPDICGTGTRRTHAIFHYPRKDDNLLITNDVRCETDQLSHLYTFHIKSDNTFDILIDQKSVKQGNLADEWEFLEPEQIKDPELSKPADWVDEKKIDDPEAVKPEGYDDIPAEIPDPEAAKPEDWDDEDDGEWEPPMIDNPEYKGPWKAPKIDNPEYKGEWEHPLIANPDFVPDDKLHARCVGCKYVGFELWQVKAGTVFDDIIVTDSIEEANAFAEKTWAAKKDAEKEMFDTAEEARKEAEKAEREAKKAEREAAKAAEEAAKAAAEEEEDEEDEEEQEL